MGFRRGSHPEITKSIANQQGVGGGLFTPDQSFIHLTKKGLLTFYPYWCGIRARYECSEECVELVQEELLCSLQRVELPLFASCPVFKKRLLETMQSFIRTWV